MRPKNNGIEVQNNKIQLLTRNSLIGNMYGTKKVLFGNIAGTLEEFKCRVAVRWQVFLISHHTNTNV